MRLFVVLIVAFALFVSGAAAESGTIEAGDTLHAELNTGIFINVPGEFNFTNFSITSGQLQFWLNNSRLQWRTGTNKTLTNIQFITAEDNFTFNANGTDGYLNFSGIMNSASTNYSFYLDTVFQEYVISDSNKIITVNYTGAWSDHIFTVIPTELVYSCLYTRCVNSTGWWNASSFNPSATPISSAIDNSSSFDTVYVYNGIYTETVTVTINNLTIQGESSNLVNLSGGFVINAGADYVNITEFNITSSSVKGITVSGNHSNISYNKLKTTPGGWTSLYIGGNYNLCLNNTIVGSDYGIRDYGNYNSYYNNTVSNSILRAVWLSSGTYGKFIGGTLDNSGLYDYYCYLGCGFVTNFETMSGYNNNGAYFIDTNFTVGTTRKIYQSAGSILNITSNNITIITAQSDFSSILNYTRTIYNLSMSNITFKDSGVNYRGYRLHGLIPNSTYLFYKNDIYQSVLTTNSTGDLDFFKNNDVSDAVIKIVFTYIQPNITAWYNSINGWNQTAMSINAGNSATFNITVDQAVDNVSWSVAGSEEQNTSSLEFTRAFNTLGNFNVTAQAFNANGSSNIIYTVVTVTSTGGGGTDWDYAYGWVKYSNGTAVNLASVTTSKGTEYTDSNGYYSFGYVFEHGLDYDFNVTKAGHTWHNQTITFTTGDYEIVNATIDYLSANPVPGIISWENDNTSNNTLTFTVDRNTNVTFNATANQTITTWAWTGATEINGSGSTNTYAYKNFTAAGIQTVSIYGTNYNGTTQTMTWTVTVLGASNLTLSGYVDNSLGAYLKDARVDLNSEYDLTDAAGYYEFVNITEGSYTVLVRAIGYRNSTNTTTISADTELNFTMNERIPGIVSIPGFTAISIIFILALTIILIKKSEGDIKMACKLHKGKRGGRYKMKRKRGGGTRRVYI